MRQLNPQITNADKIYKDDILRLPRESSPQKSGTDRSRINDKWQRVEGQIEPQFPKKTQLDDLLTNTKRDIKPETANDMADLVAQFRAVEIARPTQNSVPIDSTSNQSNSEEQEYNANGGDSQTSVEEAVQADAPNTNQSEQYTPEAEQDQMPDIPAEFVDLIRKEIAQIFEGKEEALLEEITLLKAADTSSEGRLALLEGAESECCSLLDRVKTLERNVKNMPKRIEQIQEHRRRFPLGNIWDYPN